MAKKVGKKKSKKAKKSKKPKAKSVPIIAPAPPEMYEPEFEDEVEEPFYDDPDFEQ